MIDGISVVICTHNGSKLLPATLAHLGALPLADSLPWEVIVVDNASTDDTAKVAQATWTGPAPFRVVHEPQPGVAHARRCGVQAARYEIVSFVDDDNWVSPNWLALVTEIMNAHPDVGICGGPAEGVYEGTPPSWFLACARTTYALGRQAATSGDITHSRGFVWGAGMSIRKQPLLQLYANGFDSLVVGQSGLGLSRGEDVEICFVFCAMGWAIWYDERLHLKHYIPKARWQWAYMRSLNREHGRVEVALDVYAPLLANRSKWSRGRAQKNWQWRLVRTSVAVLKSRRKLWSILTNPRRGNPNLLWLEAQLWEFWTVLKLRERYDRNLEKLRAAAWLKSTETSLVLGPTSVTPQVGCSFYRQ